VREAVRLGTGIAVLPPWLIEEDLLSGRLIRIYPVQRRLTQRVRTFIDFAVEYMPLCSGLPQSLRNRGSLSIPSEALLQFYYCYSNVLLNSNRG